MKILGRVEEYFKANKIMKLTKIQEPICWKPPKNNWIKINVDGFLYDQEVKIACAGMVRDAMDS